MEINNKEIIKNYIKNSKNRNKNELEENKNNHIGKKFLLSATFIFIIGIFSSALIVPISIYIPDINLSMTSTSTPLHSSKININNQSSDQTVYSGDFADFSITASVTNPLNNEQISYQWYESSSMDYVNGVIIPNETTSSIRISTLNFSSGPKYYYCKMSYANAEPIDSKIFTLNVILKPVINLQNLVDQSAIVGDNAIFNISANIQNATGGIIGYQWYITDSNINFNGTLISNEINSSLTINTSGLAGQTKYYYCIVSYPNAVSVTSNIVTLNITPAPIINISTQPANQTVDPGVSSTFSINATIQNSISGENISYQWYVSDTNSSTSGTLIPGASTNSYTVNTTSLAGQTKYYYCIVSYLKATSVTSSVASLIVNPNASIGITTQPLNQSIIPGNSATFSIQATILNTNPSLTGNFSYQWYFNTTNSTTGSTVMNGETAATLALNDTASFINSTRYYYCVVSYPGLTPLTSNIVTLTTSNSFNQASATNALNLWLSNKNNQKTAWETYFSNSTNASVLYRNAYSTIGNWVNVQPSISVISIDEILANSVTGITFDTWKINLNVTSSNGTFLKYVGSNWDYAHPYSIPLNSTISFYLPFSLVENVSLTSPSNQVYSTNVNKTFSSTSSSISWVNNPNQNLIAPTAFTFKITDPSNTVLVNSRFQFVGRPTLTSSNAGLPVYTPYN